MIREPSNMGKQPSNKKKSKVGIIFNQIRLGKSPYAKDFMKKHNLSESTVSYYINKLKRNRNIKWIGKSIWKIINPNLRVGKGYSIEGKGVKNPKKDWRGHAYIVTFDIRKIRDWNNRSKWLKNQGIPVKDVKTGFGSYPMIVIDGWKTKLCRKSIIFNTPRGYSVFGVMPDQAYLEFLKDIRLRVLRLERLFRLGKKGIRLEDDYAYRISRAEYANVHHVMAKLFNKAKVKVEAFDSKGRLRFLIDDSFGKGFGKTGEEEYVGPRGLSLTDAQRYAKNRMQFLDDKNPLFYKDKKRLFENQASVNDMLSKTLVGLSNQANADRDFYAKNFATHSRVLKKMEKVLDVLRKKYNKK